MCIPRNPEVKYRETCSKPLQFYQEEHIVYLSVPFGSFDCIFQAGIGNAGGISTNSFYYIMIIPAPFAIFIQFSEYYSVSNGQKG